MKQRDNFMITIHTRDGGKVSAVNANKPNWDEFLAGRFTWLGKDGGEQTLILTSEIVRIDLEPMT